jgi:hypothetical protein
MRVQITFCSFCVFSCSITKWTLTSKQFDGTITLTDYTLVFRQYKKYIYIELESLC